jgi:hypothetical protein
MKRDESSTHVRTILVGVLAGDDLLLTEVGAIAGGLSAAFGIGATLELGTVNDEATFSGRLAAAVLVFEESAVAKHSGEFNRAARSPAKHRNKTSAEAALAATDRFSGAEKTIWHDEDLDIPTYIRRDLTLDR